MNILIIEDDPALLRGLKDNFEARGYHVRTANDGQKGLMAILQDPPDAVLLDLKLPKVDGIEVLRRIKADSRTNHVPVVMLTSSQEERDVLDSYNLGVNSYIVKPVDFSNFVHAVSELGVYWGILNKIPY